MSTAETSCWYEIPVDSEENVELASRQSQRLTIRLAGPPHVCGHYVMADQVAFEASREALVKAERARARSASLACSRAATVCSLELERRIRLHLLPCFGGRRLAAITTAEVNAVILNRQKEVMVVAEGDDRQERRYSNGEINAS